jgi:hypothetical protein
MRGTTENRLRAGAFVVGCCWLVGTTPASAQSPSLSASLNFLEVFAGTNTPVPNPNGVIEPGEAARIELTIALSPPVGTHVQTAHGAGILAGLYYIIYDLRGSMAAEGSWSHLTRAPGWALGGPGEPQAGGALVAGLSAGQTLPPGALANPQNPIEQIWSGVWTPAAYTARTTIFQVDHPSPPPATGSAHVIIQTGTNPNGSPIYSSLPFIPSQFGSVQVPVIPAPGTLGGWLLAFLVFNRRRR